MDAVLSVNILIFKMKISQFNQLKKNEGLNICEPFQYFNYLVKLFLKIELNCFQLRIFKNKLDAIGCIRVIFCNNKIWLY